MFMVKSIEELKPQFAKEVKTKAPTRPRVLSSANLEELISIIRANKILEDKQLSGN